MTTTAIPSSPPHFSILAKNNSSHSIQIGTKAIGEESPISTPRSPLCRTIRII